MSAKHPAVNMKRSSYNPAMKIVRLICCCNKVAVMLRAEKRRKICVGFALDPDVYGRLNLAVAELKTCDETISRSKFLNWLLKHILSDNGLKKVVELYLKSEKR